MVVQRLLAAINAHDLEAMVACFADDYVNEWPAHPQRGFQGRQTGDVNAHTSRVGTTATTPVEEARS